MSSLCQKNETKLTGCKVLVIAGHPDSFAELGHVLKRWGHRVQSASGAHDALPQARRFRPELVLFDLSFPHWDGFEAAHQIKSTLTHRHIFLLAAMTDHLLSKVPWRGKGGLFDRQLIKPVDMEQVREILLELREGL